MEFSSVVEALVSDSPDLLFSPAELVCRRDIADGAVQSYVVGITLLSAVLGLLTYYGVKSVSAFRRGIQEGRRRAINGDVRANQDAGS